MKEVHTVILEYRLKKNHTQAAVAAAIGVSLRHYRNLEQGKKHFYFHQILVLKEVLGIKIDDLFYPPPDFKQLIFD